jgi:hypothetical protein
MLSFFSTADEMDSCDCHVRIGLDEVSIIYEGDRGTVTYKGKDKGGGHFTVYSYETKGYGTLHRLRGEPIFEGSWVESGSHGMWRIELNDDK